MANEDDLFDNPEAPEADDDDEPHHKAYEREEEGHEEHVGALGDDDIRGPKETKSEYLRRAESLFTIEDPEEQRKALNNADAKTKEAYEFLQSRAGYAYRKQKETQRRIAAKAAARSAARIQRNEPKAVENAFGLRSIRMRPEGVPVNNLHYVQTSPIPDEPEEDTGNTGTEGVVTKQEVEAAEDRHTKLKKEKKDLEEYIAQDIAEHGEPQKGTRRYRQHQDYTASLKDYDKRIGTSRANVEYVKNVYQEPYDIGHLSPDDEKEFKDLNDRAGVTDNDTPAEAQKKIRRVIKDKDQRDKWFKLWAAQETGRAQREHQSVLGSDLTQNEIRRFNRLRQKNQALASTGGLQGREANEFNLLRKKMSAFSPEITRDSQGRTPHDVERDRIQAALTEQDKPEPYLPHGYSPENAEKPTYPKDVYSKSGHEDTDLGFREGWQRTHEFNKEQKRRAIQGFVSGNTPYTLGHEPLEKAKLSLSSNKEVHIKTTNWEPLGPKKDFENTHDEYTFKLDKSPQELNYISNQGDEWRTSGVSLSQALKDTNLDGKVIVGDFTKNPDGTINHKVHTESGVHLTPDEQAQFKEILNTYYGIQPDTFQSKGTARWTNQRWVSQVGSSDIPKGLKPEDIAAGSRERQIFQGHGGVRFGERDPVTGELLPGERDRIGIVSPFKKGPQTLQYNLYDDTDAIGFGTNWRPGNKEIHRAVTAIPEARQNRKLVERYINDEPLVNRDDYATEAEYEEANNNARRKAQKHLKDLTAAGVSSAYYTAKKKPRNIANPIYRKAVTIPGIGSHVRNAAENLDWVNKYDDIRTDINTGVRKPLGLWIDKTKRGARTPLGVFKEDGSMDRSASGIGFEKPREGVKDLLSNSIRYRRRFLGKKAMEEREGRKVERTVRNLNDLGVARENMNKFVRGESDDFHGRLGRWSNIAQVRSQVSGLSGHDMGDMLVNRVNNTMQMIDAELAKSKEANPHWSEARTMGESGRYRAYLEAAKENLEDLSKRIKESPDDYSTEKLAEEFEQYMHSPGLKLTPTIPDAAITAGKYGLAAAAVGGAAVLGTDMYQTYRSNRGMEVRHPVLKAVPETISRPTVSIKRTQTVTLPKNTVTEFFDVEGKKMPTAWRVSKGQKQIIRLRNHRDISGEGYKENIPLIGGIELGAPAPVKGSMAKAFVQPNERTTNSKNIYIAGKNTHVQLDVGAKERWDNKRHKLKASNNPYKLDNEDRKKLLAAASINPAEEDRLRNFYSNDPKFQEQLEEMQNPNVRGKIKADNLPWLAPDSKNLVNVERKADTRRYGRTLEEESEEGRNFSRGQRENRRSYVGPANI